MRAFMARARARGPLALGAALCLSGPALAATAPLPEPAAILVSRQLLESEGLAVGDLVSLSSDPSGADAAPFRIVGVYEPTPDPQRLGATRLEVRLHLPDMIGLTSEAGDADAAESVSAINVRLLDPQGAAGLARELSARLPGLIVRPTAADGDATASFVVLERFHQAIALVTVAAASLFLLALMVMFVDERRATVAVLRLIGLAKRRILLHVLAEGLLIALAGAAFGVALAVLLQGGFNRFFQAYYDTPLVFVEVTPRIAWRSVLLAVPLGVLASLASSWGLLRQGVLSLARR
jgi:putative ABC transport system permease protein